MTTTIRHVPLSMWICRVLMVLALAVFLWAVWPTLANDQTLSLAQVNSQRIDEIAARVRALESSQQQLLLVQRLIDDLRTDVRAVTDKYDRIQIGIIALLSGFVVNVVMTWKPKKSEPESHVLTP